MTRQELIDVFYDTRELVATIYKEQTKKLCKATTVYTEHHLDNFNANKTDELIPSINIVISGTVNAGYYYSKSYAKVAILNFADDVKFGGWVENGAPTQEEDICRCTNLYESLGTHKCARGYYDYNKKFKVLDARNPSLDVTHLYGKGSDRVIYSPDVLVLKEDTEYREFNNPSHFDVITCPSPSVYTPDVKVFEHRIDGILKSAIMNNVQCIILGAWGCGAFGQDPQIVATAFANSLNKYGYAFDKIVFAMKASAGKNTLDTNYNAFSEVLEREFIGGVKYEI